MASFQEQYWEVVGQIKELQKSAKRRIFNDETKRVIEDNIRSLQSQIEGAQTYVMESESLAFQAMEFKKIIANEEKCVAELETIFERYAPTLRDDDDISKIAERKEDRKRIENLLSSMNTELAHYEIEKMSYTELVAEFENAKTRNTSNIVKLNEITNTIVSNRDRITRRLVTESEMHSDELEVILEPEMLGSDSEATVESEEISSDSLREIEAMRAEIESMNDSITMISTTNRFREIIAERNDRWEKISEIKKVRLETGRYRADASRMKQLREDEKEKDNFIKEYIHEFSRNSDYEKSEELIKLIGIRENADDRKNGNYGTTLVRPTVGQHLVPIENIDKQLEEDKIRDILNLPDTERDLFLNANDISLEQKGLIDKLKNLSDEEKNRIKDLNPLSKEEKEKLEKEKAERERRLGKKLLVKLKMDKLNTEIKVLESKLKDAIKNGATPEEIEAIKNELGLKQGELAALQKEYGEILNEIGNLIADSVEKAELNKHGVKSIEELKNKLDMDKEKMRSSITRTPQTPERTESTRSAVGTPLVGGNNIVNGTVPSASHTETAPSAGFGGTGISQTTNESSKNLPAERKSLKDRIVSLFKNKEDKKKDEEKKEKEACEVLRSEKLEYDFASQYAMFPPAKVEGKYFYHTIKNGDELQYVREPLENMRCTKRELVQKVKELQKIHGIRDFEKSYDDSRRGMFGSIANFFKDKTVEDTLNDNQRKKDLRLNGNAKSIVDRQLGISTGEERQLRMLKMMCGLEAAHLSREVINSFEEGIGKEQFNPSVKTENKKIVFVENSKMPEEFRTMVEAINNITTEEAVVEHRVIPNKEVEIRVSERETDKLELPKANVEVLQSFEDIDLSAGTSMDWGLDDPELLGDESSTMNNRARGRTSATLIPERKVNKNRESTRVPQRTNRVKSRSSFTNTSNIPPVPIFDRHAKREENSKEESR